jgi:hypothetical protein
MTKKLKHLLPAYSVLEHCSLDDKTLAEMRNCVSELSDQFKTTIEVNKKLCSVHNDLTKSSYDNFYQISLTDSEVENDYVSPDQLAAINTELNSMSAAENLRLKKKLSTDDTNPMNESTFIVKTDTYNQYKTLFDKVLGQFKGAPTRMRLVKLCAGASITPHIDYDPSYSVRVIIPILTEKECVNLFWVKNNIESVSMENGKAYFLNTGYKHAVINYSGHDRYTFMITLKNTNDIEHLLSHEYLQIS